MATKDDITRFVSKYGMDGRSEVIDSKTVRVFIRDEAGKILLCTGLTIPTGAGYAKGCLFIDTDVAGGTGGLYANKGTTAAASFSLVTQA
jgi:hypothetical protein